MSVLLKIVKVRDSNKAVLLVSLEIDEVFDLADTIYTIYEGRITGKFKPENTTYKEIGLYETGAACQDEYLHSVKAVEASDSSTEEIIDKKALKKQEKERRKFKKQRAEEEKSARKEDEKAESITDEPTEKGGEDHE